MTVIYDAATWNAPFYNHPRRQLLLDWLNANGIKPIDVPLEQRINLRDGTIHYVAICRRGDGTTPAVYGKPVLEARTAPCTVQPPAELTKEP